MAIDLTSIEFDRRTLLFRLALQVTGLTVFALSVYWWLAYGVAREVFNLSTKASTFLEALLTPAGDLEGTASRGSSLKVFPPWCYLISAISGAISALGCLLLARRTTRILDWVLAVCIAFHSLGRFLVVSFDWTSAIWTLALLGLVVALTLRPSTLFAELHQ